MSLQTGEITSFAQLDARRRQLMRGINEYNYNPQNASLAPPSFPVVEEDDEVPVPIQQQLAVRVARAKEIQRQRVAAARERLQQQINSRVANSGVSISNTVLDEVDLERARQQGRENESVERVSDIRRQINRTNKKPTDIAVQCKLTQNWGTEIQDVCAICIEEYKPDEYVVKTNCGHFFHAECASFWAAKSVTCAVCKQNI